MSLRIFLFFVAASVVVASDVTPDPVVKISHGLLNGKWLESTGGRSFAAFRGVPFARPPVGKYRFREPQQLKPWPGVWDATRYQSDCQQYDPMDKIIIGSEDCLYVNVFTPKLDAGASMPVMVFIHGGAFMFGSGALYDPVHLMDLDMVVVTLNYRLGPLGFLSTGDEVIPGNFGLKDQSFALHWVQNNIRRFGGNPDSVTLTGCSAGGASVHYHYLSPLSKGTFARGIAFSGSAFSSWTHAVKPAEKAKKLASIVGCSSANSLELAECLRYRPSEHLVKAQIQMYDWQVHMFTPFTPTIEPRKAREPFITDYPYLIAQAGRMHKVPLIATVTSEEGLYPAAVYQKDPEILPEIEAEWSRIASYMFEYNDTLPVDQKAAVAAKIKDKYLGGKPVTQETYSQLVQALGDRLFVADVGKLAQIHAAKSGQPVYVYQYKFHGEKSLSNILAMNDENYGVSHADDVFHIFNFPGLFFTSSEDKKIIKALNDMIYSFSTKGVPSFGKGKWKAVQPGSPKVDYLEISSADQAEMKSSADFGQRAFWDSLGFIENDRYKSNLRDEL